MSGQKTRRSMSVGRVVIALLAGGVAILLAPIASATPESDANDAITAAWDANEGAEGKLGPKNGDVYPVGDGFGQDFASGKIFFTPATGARIMAGAILEKYESLGGPADSDLGFPTIDEGPGRAPDSRNTTFSASDKPVIFWTPDTGARVVRGPINAAWDKLGGSAGALGVPVDDEVYRGDTVSQKFTGGELSYNTQDKVFTTIPPDLAGQLAGLAVPDDPTSAINAARRAAGGTLGPLGAAQGPPYPIGQDGLGQNFAGGKIFYTPATGASVITGQVLAKYESVGGPLGDLGFPTISEVDGGLATASRMSRFSAADEPVIFWTPDHGAVIVRGAMNAAWDELGGAKGELGAPMADQTEDGDVITQRFSGGVISWDRSANTFRTEPPNLASALSGLQVPGQDTPKAPSSAQAPDSNGNKWFEWSWWWLLAIVPVLTLVGLIAFATLRNRRTDQDDGRFEMDDAGFGGDAAPDFGTAGAPERSTTADDDYHAAMFGEGYAREGLHSVSTPAEDQSDVSPAQANLWSGPPRVDDDESPAPHGEDEQQDPDAVDTAPTRVPTAVVGAVPGVEPTDDLFAERIGDAHRNRVTETGRHARIVEPEPPRTAFRLALDDPHEAPDGYPIKADTKSGLYFVPGSPLFEAAPAEIWFSSAELARTNGFVPGD